MLKKEVSDRIIGPVILFGALFLPGYLFQDPQAASAILSDPRLIGQNIVLQIPQVALLAYIIMRCGHTTPESAGITRLRPADMLKALAGLAGLFIISIPTALIGSQGGDQFFSPVRFDGANTGVLLLLIPFCLVSAYREELFFRSHLLTELEPFGNPARIAFSSLLFALGHLYQGIGAFIATALIGIFLSWLFLRSRSVHVVAISHGMYNYLVLVAGLSL